MQPCQLSLGEHNHFHINTVLCLRPDRSKHKLQINICCLIAKHHLWLCRSKRHLPNLNNFLLYLKHIYQIQNNTSVAAGFPVFFALVFSRRFLEPYKSSFAKLLDISFVWSDSPEVTATFSRSWLSLADLDSVYVPVCTDWLVCPNKKALTPVY